MNKTKLRILLSILLISLVNAMVACTFLPGVQEEQPYVSDQCQLVTRQLDLNAYLGSNKVDFLNDAPKQSQPKKSDSSGFKGFGKKGDEALLAIVVVWAGVTFVVSSSIVVTGNILHWSEYQRRCDESELRQYVYRH